MTCSTSKNQVCSHRHSFALDNIFRRLIHSPKRIVGPYLSIGATAIDLGCGPGFFTLPMAELVGPTGRVFAVDLQEEMLHIVRSKIAERRDQSMHLNIEFHQCSEHEIGLEENIEADFILAYYMVHETQDHYRFFDQVRRLLKPGGTFLVVEPPFHVTQKAFITTLGLAERAGFVILDRPKGKGGKSALLSTCPPGIP